MQLLPKSDWDDVVPKPYLDARLAEMRAELGSELGTQIGGVRVELHEAVHSLLVWLIGAMVAIAGVIIAAFAAAVAVLH